MFKDIHMKTTPVYRNSHIAPRAIEDMGVADTSLLQTTCHFPVVRAGFQSGGLAGHVFMLDKTVVVQRTCQ